MLASAIAETSSEAARCIQLLPLFNTDVMKKHLADVYEQVFLLFTDAIRWYTSSSTSRFRASFSDAFPKRVADTTTQIRRLIDEMDREKELAVAGELKDTHTGVEQLHIGVNSVHGGINQLQHQMGEGVNEVHQLRRAVESLVESKRVDSYSFRQESPWFGQAAGITALHHLESMVQMQMQTLQVLSAIHTPSVSRGATPEPEQIEDTTPVAITSRKDASEFASRFSDFVVGHDGVSHLVDHGSRYTEPEALDRLKTWLTSTETSELLAVCGPPEMFSTRNAPQTLAIAAIGAAHAAKTAYISHFCDVPPEDDVTPGMSQELAGLLGLIYDLIIQLLAFPADGTSTIDLSANRFDQLDQTATSLEPALALLRDLLADTGSIPYCIIDNFGILDYDSGVPGCREFLEMLIERQQTSESVFNVLLTNAGTSETVLELVPLDNLVFLQHKSRRIQHSGEVIELRLPER